MTFYSVCSPWLVLPLQHCLNRLPFFCVSQGSLEVLDVVSSDEFFQRVLAFAVLINEIVGHLNSAGQADVSTTSVRSNQHEDVPRLQLIRPDGNPHTLFP